MFLSLCICHFSYQKQFYLVECENEFITHYALEVNPGQKRFHPLLDFFLFNKPWWQMVSITCSYKIISFLFLSRTNPVIIDRCLFWSLTQNRYCTVQNERTKAIYRQFCRAGLTRSGATWQKWFGGAYWYPAPQPPPSSVCALQSVTSK